MNVLASYIGNTLFCKNNKSGFFLHVTHSVYCMVAEYGGMRDEHAARENVISYIPFPKVFLGTTVTSADLKNCHRFLLRKIHSKNDKHLRTTDSKSVQHRRHAHN